MNILSEKQHQGMRYNKTFTIDEARALLPRLIDMLGQANDELDQFADRLEIANQQFLEVESELANIKTSSAEISDLTKLRKCRARFQQRSQQLSEIQQEYLSCMNAWVDKITDLGVVLRDLRSGLLDFPAQKGDFEYLLCWRLADEDIEYWHLPNDGFVGRRTLAVLSEYF